MIEFDKYITKKLSAVEAEPDRSNQHELNGVSGLKALLGEQRKDNFNAHFVFEGDSSRVIAKKVTWYDAREQHPERSEFRLYFQTNDVMTAAREGSVLKIGFDHERVFWIELAS
ncbi:hypothetical protein [Salinivibrio sp. IB872]|uniref:hypothetical protein n=1 Tax=Salinivibrio sp. IB872 TaxID=1766123 RepID=UPI0009847621|nr:hypothetical protein [Salinivibrio sp. IB872]OOF28580.1 hypothetical protein BZJ18_04825 [Salinivibrio sp. IB872]